MRKIRKGKEKKMLSKPTAVFRKKAKKPADDDMPGRMRPAAHAPRQKGVAKRAKRLQGVML